MIPVHAGDAGTTGIGGGAKGGEPQAAYAPGPWTDPKSPAHTPLSGESGSANDPGGHPDVRANQPKAI